MLDVASVDASRDLVADDNTTLWAEWRDATRSVSRLVSSSSSVCCVSFIHRFDICRSRATNSIGMSQFAIAGASNAAGGVEVMRVRVANCAIHVLTCELHTGSRRFRIIGKFALISAWQLLTTLACHVQAMRDLLTSSGGGGPSLLARYSRFVWLSVFTVCLLGLVNSVARIVELGSRCLTLARACASTHVASDDGIRRSCVVLVEIALSLKSCVDKNKPAAASGGDTKIAAVGGKREPAQQLFRRVHC